MVQWVSVLPAQAQDPSLTIQDPCQKASAGQRVADMETGLPKLDG